MDSNHSSDTQLIFRDMEDTIFGRVAGSSDGADFGLIDADGNWTYKAVKDQYTDFRVNNTSIMTLSGASIIAKGANAYRMRQAKYSVIERNDDSNYYFLMTDSGSSDA